jgi:hypothetical protein
MPLWCAPSERYVIVGRPVNPFRGTKLPLARLESSDEPNGAADVIEDEETLIVVESRVVVSVIRFPRPECAKAVCLGAARSIVSGIVDVPASAFYYEFG